MPRPPNIKHLSVFSTVLDLVVPAPASYTRCSRNGREPIRSMSCDFKMENEFYYKKKAPVRPKWAKKEGK